MSPRKYEQRRRAESADVTRRRILDAVYQRMRDAPTEPPSLDRVAQLAGVARSTIYVVFGSRAGLFEAFSRDLWQRSGVAELTQAVAHPDAREHLRGGFLASSKMYAAERDVYRVLFSMARLEPDPLGGAVDTMERGRLGGMKYLVRRLREQEYLRPDVPPAEAVNVLWALAGFDTFDLLYTGRHLSAAKVTKYLVDTAERSLLR